MMHGPGKYQRRRAWPKAGEPMEPSIEELRAEFRDRQVAGRITLIDRAERAEAPALIVLLAVTLASPRRLIRIPLTRPEVARLVELAMAEA